MFAFSISAFSIFAHLFTQSWISARAVLSAISKMRLSALVLLFVSSAAFLGANPVVNIKKEPEVPSISQYAFAPSKRKTSRICERQSISAKGNGGQILGI